MSEQEKTVQYAYDVSLQFISNNKPVDIFQEYINNIIITKEYYSTNSNKKNMPIIYITLIANSLLYNDIAIDSEQKSFILKISKYDSLSNIKSSKLYINDQFAYKSTIDPYAVTDLKNEESEIKEEDLHRITIGLYKKELVNNNKKSLINCICKSTNIVSIVHKYTSHMKMLIEPFDNNTNIPYIIIPPTESITELLKFLNLYYGLYNTPYVFFMDFNLTYLISTKGNIIDAKDNTYNTITITIRDKDSESATEGIKINPTKKIYMMDVLSKNVDINKNKAIDNQINVLSGVSSDGFSSSQIIKVNQDSNSTKKEKYIKVYNNNQNYINQLKIQAELQATTIVIYKENVDNSLFTPNKEYNIISKTSTKDINGKYFLVSKQEIYLFADNKFKSNIILLFQKIS